MPLPARQVEALLDSRQGIYARKIAHMDACGDTSRWTEGQRFVRGFGQAIYQAAHAYIEEHRHEVLRESLGVEVADAAE